MGIREMSDTGRPLSEKDLRAIEKKLHVQLPESYRHFLSQYNGGTPEPHYYGTEGTLHYFYGVDPIHDCYDLWDNYKTLRRELPAGVIPIATDPFGNAFCLATRGENRGKVYLWDHEGASPAVDLEAEFPSIIFNPYAEGEPRPKIKDDWPGYPDLSLIADSFDEFLDSFHDGDDKAPKRRKKKPSNRKKPAARRKT